MFSDVHGHDESTRIKIVVFININRPFNQSVGLFILVAEDMKYELLVVKLTSSVL